MRISLQGVVNIEGELRVVIIEGELRVIIIVIIEDEFFTSNLAAVAIMNPEWLGWEGT